MKTKHSIRQTLLSVMNDANATPKDRLAASLQLGRLKKGKPRGLSAKKPEVISEPVEKQPIEPKPTGELSPAERIQRAIGSGEERVKFAEEYEAKKRARTEALNAMELSPAESDSLRAKTAPYPCVSMDAGTLAKHEEGARLRYLEKLLCERLPEDEKQDFQGFYWYKPEEKVRAQAAYKAAIGHFAEQRSR
jgi:hypothetical protein